MRKKRETADFDSPWKEILDRFLPYFLAFFFPKLHAGIDWSRGYTACDKELQKIVRDATAGRRFADKLYQVWTVTGEEEHLFVHVEVQGDPEAEFAARMYQYWSRIRERYGKPVVSLAVLTDEDLHWRPEAFETETFGCGVIFRFLATKLSDQRASWEKLEADPNPFAVVVMAHLKAQETAADPQARYRAKWALTRDLYRRGYCREDVLELYRFIDWLLNMPEELEQQLWKEIQTFEKEQRMPYMSYVERMGYKKGKEEGEEEGEQRGEQRVLQKQLRRRFGTLPPWAEERLACAEPATLEDWAERLLDAQSLEEVFADS